MRVYEYASPGINIPWVRNASRATEPAPGPLRAAGRARLSFRLPHSHSYRLVVLMRFAASRRWPVPRTLLALCVLLAHPLAGQAPELSVHSIFGTRDFAGDLVDLQWMRDGSAYTLLDDSAGQTNLYRVDPVSGNRAILLRGDGLIPAGAREPIDVESYQFSKDDTKLLIFTKSARVWRQRTKGTFYVWDFTAKRLFS